MEEILIKYPELRRNVLDTIDEFAPFSYIGITASSLSILVAVYILLFQLQPTWSKLKFDGHFQLRFTVGLLLLVNRILTLAHLLIGCYHWYIRFVWWKLDWFLVLENGNPILKQLFEEKTVQLRAAQQWLNFLSVAFLCTLNFMLVALLFLTINRYKRVTMVLPKTLEFKICRWIQIIAILIALYNTITLSWKYTFEASGIKEEYLFLIDDKLYFKLASFTFIYVIYYAFTVRLIVLSVRSGHITTQGFFQQLFQWFVKRNRQPHSCASGLDDLDQSQVRLQAENNLDAQVLQLRRLYAGMKMIGIFILLSLVDLFIFSFLVYSSVSGFFEGPNLLYLAAFATSWIVVHVLCVFYLLDMFVKDLIRANRGQTTTFVTRLATVMKRLWRNAWKQSSRADSVATDIVDLSLISGSNITTFQTSLNKGPFIKKAAAAAYTSSSANASLPSASVEYSNFQSLSSPGPI